MESVTAATQENILMNLSTSNTNGPLDYAGLWNSTDQEISNGTMSSYGNTVNSEGSSNLAEWQIILIATLSATAVTLFAVIIIICKFCKKKSNTPKVHTRNVAPAPSTMVDEGRNEEKSGCGCWSVIFSNKMTSDHHGMKTAIGQSETKESSPEYQDQSEPSVCFYIRTPLPPIGETEMRTPIEPQLTGPNGPLSPIGWGQTMPPRRLAPLNEHVKVTATNLAGGTIVRRAGMLGPVHPNVELRGPRLPSIWNDQNRTVSQSL